MEHNTRPAHAQWRAPNVTWTVCGGALIAKRTTSRWTDCLNERRVDKTGQKWPRELLQLDSTEESTYQRTFHLDISPPDIIPTGHLPWSISTPVSRDAGYFNLPPIYNLPLTCTKSIAVDRLGSGVRVRASFQIFALRGRVKWPIGEEENCRGNISRGLCPGGLCLGGMSYLHSNAVWTMEE